MPNTYSGTPMIRRHLYDRMSRLPFLEEGMFVACIVECGMSHFLDQFGEQHTFDKETPQVFSSWKSTLFLTSGYVEVISPYSSVFVAMNHMLDEEKDNRMP